jgi:hypothetical protein
VAGLVEAELDPARQGDGGQQAPALITDRPGHLDPLGPQAGHGGGDVVAQQIELGLAALGGRVDGELGWGRAKIRQPPPASTVRVPSTLARAARVASASSL